MRNSPWPGDCIRARVKDQAAVRTRRHPTFEQRAPWRSAALTCLLATVLSVAHGEPAAPESAPGAAAQPTAVEAAAPQGHLKAGLDWQTLALLGAALLVFAAVSSRQGSGPRED